MKIYPARIFDKVMSVFLRKAISACIFLMLASGTAWSNAVPPGFVEGHLNIASLGEVEPSDGNAPATTAENYAEYPLIVLSQDRQKEIARVTADGNGNYHAALPPGNYGCQPLREQNSPPQQKHDG